MNNKVCLLITTRNRSHLLNRSLERLTRLTIPDEVLVIDDGGDDNCETTAMNFVGRLPVKYIYNHEPEWTICSMARNIGIKNTDCDIVITAEPEMLFITDVVAQMLQKHQEIPNKVISAGTIYHMGQHATLHNDMITNPANRLLQEAVNVSSHGTYPVNSKGYARIQGWVAPFSALYRKEWLMGIGGWDESFIHWGYDDTDLLTRLSFSGIGQDIARDIECIHQWHDKLAPDVQHSAVIKNEKIMVSKNLCVGSPNIVANINKEWGIIKTR